jgi:hypothetical protein
MSGAWEDKPQTERKYVQMTYMVKDYYPKIYRTLKIEQYESNLLKKYAKDPNRYFTKEDM